MASQPDLANFIDADELGTLIELARFEDVGPTGLDVTCETFVPAGKRQLVKMVARDTGTLAGAALLPRIAAAYDAAIDVTLRAADGDTLAPGSVIAEYQGPLRSILTMERVALNFVTHLSGIASLTAAYVAKTAGTKASIFDTRKTLPGLRHLQKYAVACGGGATHRIGLYDAMLVKDNHIADVPLGELAAVLRDAAQRARALQPSLKFVEVEVDTLAQLEAVLAAPIDIVLLDNMPADRLKQAVAIRDQLAPHVELEASGGVTLNTVEQIAQAGVDRISVGALTHSAPSLDVGLDI